MALTRNKPRVYGQPTARNSMALATSTTVYEGAAIGVQASTGRARALVAGDLFAGFARAQASSLRDVAGAAPTDVELVAAGEVRLAVPSVVATSVGAAVYATDDDTFALSGSTLVGNIVRVPAAGIAIVAFTACVGGLSNAEATALRQAYQYGVVDVRRQSGVVAPDSMVAHTSTQLALGPAAYAYLAAAGTRRLRVKWVDLKPVKGVTTTAAGFAAGTKVIALAAAGSGASYAADGVMFAGDPNVYPLAAGLTDHSAGGNITLAVGLQTAIAASATAVTWVRRGPNLLGAANCGSNNEGLAACGHESSQDIGPRAHQLIALGDEAPVHADVPLTMMHYMATVDVPADAARLEQTSLNN